MADFLVIFGDLTASAFRISIPIVFGALGCMVSERAGIVNIGVEGMMLAGAFGGVYGSHITGNAWIGLIFAMIFGAAFGLLHAVLTITFKCGHIISGLGINLLASGITTVLLSAIWKNTGKSDPVAGLGTIEISIFPENSVLDKIFGNLSPLFYILIISIVVLWFFIYKTPLGLRLRVCGESPQTADSIGVDVYKTQYIALLLCGVLAGLGGAYLSIGDIGVFARDMVDGRGYIAMALNIFGAWHPVGVLGGGLVFSFAQSLQIRLQGDGFPVQIIQMLPYVLTLVVLLIVKNRSRGPMAAGKHFYRSERK